jgi:PAS domain S-box-containing protein
MAWWRSECVGASGLFSRPFRFNQENPWIPSADILAIAAELAENAVIVVALDDPALPFCYLNRAFEAITGYSRDEALGRPWSFLFGDDQLQPEVAMARIAIGARVPVAVTLRSYRKDGTMFWNAFRMLPALEAGGQTAYMVGVMRDVTHAIDPQFKTIATSSRRCEDERLAVSASAGARTKIERLSSREGDVLRGLVEGGSNKAIARDLNLSPRTIEIYRANLMAKLGARTLAEVLRVAFTAGLVVPS